jgi:tetratricopeptide (TPR) repeat protein
LAAESYKKLIDAEQASGKQKYSTQAATSITQIKGKLINAAIADTQSNKQKEGAKKLYDAYLLDKKDTINLYYAASTYVNAQDYDAALTAYDELKKLNYSGIGTNYLALNKASGNEDNFSTANQRDMAVKLGTHEKPKTEAIPSKRGEIYKNIALILVQKGRTEDAKKAISDARKSNPDDSSLILTEANLYLETKDYETYKKLVGEALQKDPNNKELIFNLGVISANANNAADAEKYYLKVIEIDPNYANAYLNLAALKLEDDKAILDEMSKLGNSEKDNKRYSVLKAKRDTLFKGVIPYLKKANELDPKNEDVKKTLLGVYSALEMTAEAKALKAKG